MAPYGLHLQYKLESGTTRWVVPDEWEVQVTWAGVELPYADYGTLVWIDRLTKVRLFRAG